MKSIAVDISWILAKVRKSSPLLLFNLMSLFTTTTHRHTLYDPDLSFLNAGRPWSYKELAQVAGKRIVRVKGLDGGGDVKPLKKAALPLPAPTRKALSQEFNVQLQFLRMSRTWGPRQLHKVDRWYWGREKEGVGTKWHSRLRVRDGNSSQWIESSRRTTMGKIRELGRVVSALAN